MERWSNPNMLSILIILIVSFTILNWTPIGDRAESVLLKTLTPVASVSGNTYQALVELIPEQESVKNLKEMNAILREEIIELNTEIISLRELENLNSARVAIPNNPSLTKGDVIFQEIVSGNSQVIVNVGARQAVQAGQPVVDKMGLLAGLVVSVETETSRIQLINDVKTNIPAISEYSRTQGLLTHDSNFHALRYVPKTEQIREKEILVTSVIGGRFPYGIIIGTVTRVTNSKSNIMLEIIVEIMADLNNLDRLYILTDFDPQFQSQIVD